VNVNSLPQKPVTNLSVLNQEPFDFMKLDGMDTPWYTGFSAYCQGAQLEDMPTVAHKRGWWAALDAQAAATMPAKTAKLPIVSESLIDTIEYEDDIADREYWSRGQW
jgi:hypothetical protein